MNIQQMHHEILLRLNEVGAYQHEDFLPEEIDIYINDASLKLVKDRFQSAKNRLFEGFEQSVKRVADLSPLVVIENITTLYGGKFGDFFIDYIIKPDDYLFFINQYCKTEQSDTNTFTNKLLFGDKIYPPDSESSTATYLAGDDSLNDQDVINSILPTYTSQNVDSSDFCFVEKSNGESAWLEITSVSDTKFIINDASNILSDGDDVTYHINEPFKYENNKKRVISGSDLVIKNTDGKYVQHDDLLAVLQDPFNETYNQCPIFTITDNINFYARDDFLVDNVNLTYLKVPRKVKFDPQNPVNNVDSDLPDQTHDEIIEMSISSMLSDIGDFGPNQQLTNLKDNN